MRMKKKNLSQQLIWYRSNGMSPQALFTADVELNAEFIDTKQHSPIALKNTINFLQSN